MPQIKEGHWVNVDENGKQIIPDNLLEDEE